MWGAGAHPLRRTFMGLTAIISDEAAQRGSTTDEGARGDELGRCGISGAVTSPSAE